MTQHIWTNECDTSNSQKEVWKSYGHHNSHRKSI
jgi:hypothetical protein